MLIEEEQLTYLEEPLIISGFCVLTVSFKICSNVGWEKITVVSRGVERECYINLTLADIQLTGETVIQNGEQVFNIQVMNKSQFKVDAEIEIYVNGEYRQSNKLLLNNYSSYNESFIIDDLRLGDIIFFKVISEDKENYYGDNSIKLISKLDSFKTQIVNPYVHVAQNARELIV